MNESRLEKGKHKAEECSLWHFTCCHRQATHLVSKESRLLSAVFFEITLWTVPKHKFLMMENE